MQSGPANEDPPLPPLPTDPTGYPPAYIEPARERNHYDHHHEPCSFFQPEVSEVRFFLLYISLSKVPMWVLSQVIGRDCEQQLLKGLGLNNMFAN